MNDDFAEVAEPIIEGVEAPSAIAAEDDGKPPRRNRRGGKSRAAITPEIESGDTPQPPDYSVMGRAMSETIFAIFAIIGGPDFRPEAEENAALAQAWAEYFEMRGVQSFPPEYMMLMIYGGYVGRRLTMPTTQARIQNFIKWWRERKNARPNHWDNGVGKDNPSG